MLDSERYFVGRQVLASLPVKSNIPSNPDYMVPTNVKSEPFVTHKTRITSIEGNEVVLNDEFAVKLSDLIPLNDPQKFHHDMLGNL